MLRTPRTIFVGALLAMALSPGTTLAAQVDVGAGVTNWDISVTISGPIVPGDAGRLRQALGAVRDRLVRAYLNSEGGDVATAMEMGRVLRAHDAHTNTVLCLSSCVLAHVGGVRRTGYEAVSSLKVGVGVHRFYFVDVSPNATREEISKARAVMRTSVAAYLSEMNVPQELLSFMETVPPERIRFLTEAEMDRLGINGEDPVWEEQQTARFADMHGVTSATYRQRNSRGNVECRAASSKGDGYPRYDFDVFECREAILYGLSKAEYQRRRALLPRVCERAFAVNGDAAAGACMKAVMVYGRTTF